MCKAQRCPVTPRAGQRSRSKKKARQIGWRALFVLKSKLDPRQRGASTITTCRPSKRASCSTLAISATSFFTFSSSFVPISW
ncbi:hypothetical protein BJ123_10353 [Rhodopseudomonas thermotolerans]|uniref:Uncharacterized protein n=2 Tax=Rhodopseudomonas TaxID=1073 RepID=A0A336JIC2_9BRAD|nr:hypothetical protein BJ125_10353 [Rhodopseudomonas pentothenatexigens]REG06766.1 hypothetical protein BJ123_10353 [Rhodopseudomonas thermotolerans]SSW89515.1 hypothetical protein SAMN05892882_10353 [Rhodopseudomonas pentothenatexigens]